MKGEIYIPRCQMRLKGSVMAFGCVTFFVLGIVALMFSSCAAAKTVDHYIMGFIQRVDTLYLVSEVKPNHISVRYDVKGQTVCGTYENQACAALRAQYGDTHYKEKLHHTEMLYREEAWVFCSDRIDSVQITAAVDVDTEHPAGSSLNDLFYVFSVTPDDYLRNGYRRDEEAYERVKSLIPAYIRSYWPEHDEDVGMLQRTLMPIFGRLDLLDFSQYALLGKHDYLMKLYPKKEFLTGDLGLRMRVCFRSGRVVEAVVVN